MDFYKSKQAIIDLTVNLGNFNTNYLIQKPVCFEYEKSPPLVKIKTSWYDIYMGKEFASICLVYKKKHYKALGLFFKCTIGTDIGFKLLDNSCICLLDLIACVSDRRYFIIISPLNSKGEWNYHVIDWMNKYSLYEDTSLLGKRYILTLTFPSKFVYYLTTRFPNTDFIKDNKLLSEYESYITDIFQLVGEPSC